MRQCQACVGRIGSIASTPIIDQSLLCLIVTGDSSSYYLWSMNWRKRFVSFPPRNRKVLVGLETVGRVF